MSGHKLRFPYQTGKEIAHTSCTRLPWLHQGYMNHVNQLSSLMYGSGNSCTKAIRYNVLSLPCGSGERLCDE